MSYYFLAQIKINEPEEYQKYIDQVDKVFALYNGKYLVVDDTPVVLEGNWNYTRTVLIEFKSKKEFEDWYYSEDYQQILKYRLTAAKCDSILLKGAKF